MIQADMLALKYQLHRTREISRNFEEMNVYHPSAAMTSREQPFHLTSCNIKPTDYIDQLDDTTVTTENHQELIYSVCNVQGSRFEAPDWSRR